MAGRTLVLDGEASGELAAAAAACSLACLAANFSSLACFFGSIFFLSPLHGHRGLTQAAETDISGSASHPGPRISGGRTSARRSTASATASAPGTATGRRPWLLGRCRHTAALGTRCASASLRNCWRAATAASARLRKCDRSAGPARCLCAATAPPQLPAGAMIPPSAHVAHSVARRPSTVALLCRSLGASPARPS